MPRHGKMAWGLISVSLTRSFFDRIRRKKPSRLPLKIFQHVIKDEIWHETSLGTI